MTNRPTASISLDLDNKWSYLKVRGDSSWSEFPGYFGTVVPRIVDFLDERELQVTTFIVGQDAALEVNRDPLGMIAAAGHEIGNHSFHHEPWLHLYSPNQLNDEFEKSETAIERATGRRPVGFRGPGFSCSQQVLRLLMRRGYQYDGSTFATSLGPVARAYYFLNSSFSRKQREERKELFGSFSDAFQCNKPFVWTDGESRLVEIPVTTMPFSRFPIHASYLNFLGGYSRPLAKAYFWKAIQLCRLTGTAPSFLLHPTDFLGAEDEPEMAFFPGMKQRSYRKLELLSDCLAMLSKYFNVVTMGQHAAEVLQQQSCVERSINTVIQGVAGELA